MDVTCQNGSDDCGLFAVAYATTICYGKKSEKFIFDQGLMRRHLLKCLENKLMGGFPVRKERRNSDKVINHDAVMVHCSCRTPKTKDEDMIACSSCGEVLGMRQSIRWQSHSMHYCPSWGTCMCSASLVKPGVSLNTV